MINQNMKYYFLDTEFHEDGEKIDLISIGVISEEDHEFYRICTEFNPSECNDFIRSKVLPNLGYAPWKTKQQIRNDMMRFLDIDPNDKDDNKKIQFIGYYSSYDYVILSQLFGRIIEMPTQFSDLILDVKQEAFMNNVDLSVIPNDNEPNALADAYWNKQAWEYLQNHTQRKQE